MKKNAAAFKRVIPPIIIMTSLVMVLAFQNCSQKMLVSKFGQPSNLCDTEPNRPDCPQVAQPTPFMTPPDSGTIGTCNLQDLGWCVKFYNVADPTVAPTPNPVTIYPIPRQPGAQPAVELNYHFNNGIPGANPLGVTANAWSMSSEVRWYPVAGGPPGGTPVNLNFVIEFTGSVTYTYSAMDLLGANPISSTSIVDETSPSDGSVRIKAVPLPINLSTNPAFYLLKIVWKHSGTSPAHLRIYTPATIGNGTPTPTPTPGGSPGGGTPTPTPTPTPGGSPGPLTGKVQWNIAYVDVPASDPPNCPNGTIEVGSLHGSTLTDSKFSYAYTGWLSLCAPSFADAYIQVNTATGIFNSGVYPNCHSGYDRLFSAQVIGTGALVSGIDADIWPYNSSTIPATTTSLAMRANTAWYSICVSNGLNNGAGRFMAPTLASAGSNEVGCDPGRFLAGAYDLTSAGHMVAAKTYSSATDNTGQVIPLSTTPFRMGLCLRDDVSTIPDITNLSNQAVSSTTGNRRIYWPVMDQTMRSKLDMKVVIYDEGYYTDYLSGPMNFFSINNINYEGLNYYVNSCENYKAYVVSCYKAGEPQQGCRISSHSTTWRIPIGCSGCGPGYALGVGGTCVPVN